MIRLAAAAAALLALSTVAASADPSGTWTTPEGKAQVRISDCGDGLCGTIVSLKAPNDAQGKPKTDLNNPDAGKKSRSLIGISLLSGIKQQGDQWVGNVYNPEDGRTYAGYLTEQGAGSLKLQGCALKIFCKTQIWKRS